MSNTNSIEQLKTFLKEMFQFNSNDLDFGIYRIYNLKRKEIENFIDGTDQNCLEPIISKTLELVSKIEKQVEQKALYNFLKDSNKESLLNDPLSNFEKIQQLIINFCDNEQEQENLKATLTASTKEFNITDEIKDKIYNHILGYFEMYYSNGDFGYNNRSRNLYKVPYEADYDGNDTMFHWKHKGSLYIKTGASFNAIKFKINHIGKEFELRLETNETSTDEEVARNNNKDSKQKHYKFNRFEEVEGVTRIVFNLSDKSTTKADLYKSLFKEVFKSDEEIDKYLFSEGKAVFNDLTDDYDKVQDGSMKGIGSLRVNRKTLLPKINKNFERGTKVDIVNERFTDETLETIYNIDQKLNSFYIGNDSDYFIHENLQDFLTQEKERYIKNHILSDLQTILDGKLDNTTLIIAKAFESVSSRIIEFLSTIEEFQKKLFTMKKKVVESEYCMTIDNINEKYYPEMLDNKAQVLEWESLFSVKIKTLADLKAQPTLVLDTRFFKQIDGSNPFKDKVLGEIENLDDRTNGLLINSENYQALNLIEERYAGRINCNYIDPPYNTGASEILYKNHFRHSSWLTIMNQNLCMSKKLLHKDGLINCAIDDFEVQNLGQLMNDVFGIENRLGYLIIEIKPSGRTNDEFLATSHEYILAYAKKKESVSVNFIELTEARKAEYKFSDDISAYKWRDFLRTGGYSTPKERPNSFYPIYFNPDNEAISLDLIEGYIKIEPIDSEGKQRVWRKTRPSFLKHLKAGDIKVEKTNNDYKVRIKDRIKIGSRPKSVWVGAQYDASSHGTKLLKKLFGKSPFSFAKSLFAVIETINLSTDSQSIILDQFAGSGTTGHAVIKINKEDEEEGLRKYVLVEVGKYFDTVTKSRIQKVIYTDNWKEGKPIDNNGSQKHIFKYLVLEQYEDVLDAIEQIEGDAPKNLPLKYLYKPELNKINSTLDISKPFSNKIKYGQPTKEGFIDLVDTYNYLQGYEVKTLKTYAIGSKYYKVVETIDNRIVVWRDIVLGEDDSKNVMEIAEKYPEIDSIEVNADFNILATQKDKQLQIGNRVMEVRIIHVDVFNQ
jgi:adenine-specific DNA-methyltransferase